MAAPEDRIVWAFVAALFGFIGVGLVWRSAVGWKHAMDVPSASPQRSLMPPPDAQGPFP